MRLRTPFLASILIFSSLVASLAIRFLWIRVQLTSPPPAKYQEYVSAALEDLAGSLLPALVLGLLVLWLWRLGLRARRLSEFVVSLTALSGFFAGMMAWSRFDSDSTFPAGVWLIAWPIALTVFAMSELAGRLDSKVRQRVVYSRPTQLIMDAVVIGSALWMAYTIRYDGAVPPQAVAQFFGLVVYAALLQIGLNYLWGVYSFIWRFTGLREALVIAQSVAAAALVGIVFRILFFEIGSLRVPFGVLLIQPLLAYAGMMGLRVARRIQHQRQRREADDRGAQQPKRVLLVGAGQAGQLLVRELEQTRSFQIVGFLDDDPRKQKRVINGVRVLGPTSALAALAEAFGVDEVTLCMPTAPKKALRKIVTVCEQISIPVTSVPSLGEIMLGKVSISRLRRVKMEDLLGRASIEYAKDDVELLENYCASRILVTGAAGSIGSELVRQLKEFQPSHLILLDKDENGLYEISLEVGESFPQSEAVIADVRDRERIRRVFAHHRPQVVFHAAAFKHVPLMEHHPCEAILNNVVGSRNLVDASVEFEAGSFILVSTDKAVNPTNVMGASKRVAETIVQRKASQGVATRMCCVRFGNVLGSRASVVPLFQKQIREGRNITVTHPNVQRYFMTIPEAVQLVIQAGALGRNGEIFVLDMGDPVKIVDLARDLIELSGLVLDRDIAIEFTGLRPGEKMFEELLVGSEQGVRVTRYPKIFVAEAVQRKWEELEPALKRLEKAAREEDLPNLYAVLQRLEIGYRRSRDGGSELIGEEPMPAFPGSIS